MTGIKRTRRHWLAPFWRRGLAGLVDGGVGIAGAGALVVLGLVPLSGWIRPAEGLLLVDHVAARFADDPWSAWRLWMLLAAPWVLWRTVWGATAGGTPGERLAKVSLVDASGMAAGPLRGLARGLASVLVAASVGLLLGAPWVSRTQRGFGELVSRTWLVDARPRLAGGTA